MGQSQTVWLSVPKCNPFPLPQASLPWHEMAQAQYSRFTGCDVHYLMASLVHKLSCSKKTTGHFSNLRCFTCSPCVQPSQWPLVSVSAMDCAAGAFTVMPQSSSPKGFLCAHAAQQHCCWHTRLKGWATRISQHPSTLAERALGGKLDWVRLLVNRSYITRQEVRLHSPLFHFFSFFTKRSYSLLSPIRWHARTGGHSWYI